MDDGNGASRWAGVAPATVVFALVAGIGAAVERSYARDQGHMDLRIKALETGPDSHAALVERVEHVRTLALQNRERIEAAFKELDTKLQRELTLADDTLRAELTNLDARLQGEIASSAQTRLAQLAEVNARLVALEASARENWTAAEQAAFEAQAGFKLERPK